MVLEVDGGIDARPRTADARRDRELARLGYQSLRVQAQLVLGDLPAAVALVNAAIEACRR